MSKTANNSERGQTVTAPILTQNSTKQPRFGAFFVSVGVVPPTQQKRHRGQKIQRRPLTDAGCIVYTAGNFFLLCGEKVVSLQLLNQLAAARQVVVLMAILPLYGGGTGNGHTATN